MDHYNLFYVACTRAREKLLYTEYKSAYVRIPQ